MQVDIIGVKVELENSTDKLKEIYVLIESEHGTSQIPCEYYYKYFVDSDYEHMFVTNMINKAVQETSKTLKEKLVLN